MRIDLISATGGVKDSLTSNREAADLGEWVARPRTLRLTTRPRPPMNPDGSRSRSFSRISKSCSMPSIAFSSHKSIEEIAEKIVHDALVPVFRKLHPENSDWDLSLINLCAANFLHHPSNNRDGVGRDISHIFKKHNPILKEWNVEDDDFTHNLSIRRCADKNSNPLSPMTCANISEEVIPGEREGQQSSNPGNRVDENVFSQKGKISGIDNICEICGAHMPFFAILAHERFHSMPD